MTTTNENAKEVYAAVEVPGSEVDKEDEAAAVVETPLSLELKAEEEAALAKAKARAALEEELGDEGPITFPQRLFDILDTVEYNTDIIDWLPHGKGFVIKDKKRFADEVLPAFFKKSKYTSFTRKLNRWNFTRVTRGPETGAYYNPLFQKENKKLVNNMTCINSKTAQQTQPMDPVALGMGYSMPVYGFPMMAPVDPNDPVAMAKMQEAQRQMYFSHQQAYIAHMATLQQEGKEGDGAAESSGLDATTTAQQQQQHFFMWMQAQQQQQQQAIQQQAAAAAVAAAPSPPAATAAESSSDSAAAGAVESSAKTVETEDAVAANANGDAKQEGAVTVNENV